MSPLLILPFLLSLLQALPLQTTNITCNLTTLTNTASLYLLAQTTANTTHLTPHLSPNFTYIENNTPLPTWTTTSILTHPLTIALNRTIHDLDACATYTEIIAPANPDPYVLGVQIRHSLSDSRQKISSIDTITSTKGAWLFNATSTLQHALAESRPALPISARTSRETLLDAADAYLDMWSDVRAHERVPWGAPCARLEGGAYTSGPGKEGLDTCRSGIPANATQKANSGRRYVVDVGMGSVCVFCVWGHMMDAADSHEFRLEGGKLRFVHTITSCGDKVCKL